MNLNQRQARNAGIVLIALGVIAIFNLWWLIPSALLAAGGVVVYQRQKSLGRNGEAVQGALWGLGLAVLLLLDFIIPGVLLLGGASLLMRGREAQVEARVLGTVGRLSRRRTPAITAAPAPRTPAAPAQPAPVVERREAQPGGNETVRLG
jgi:hypothetical protein